MNTLCFGDNLEVLRESIADRSVALIAGRLHKAGVYKCNNQREIPRLQVVSAAGLFKEFLPLQLPPEEVRNGRKMTVIAEPGADEAKGGLFGE
jgi:hypothetical protein